MASSLTSSIASGASSTAVPVFPPELDEPPSEYGLTHKAAVEKTTSTEEVAAQARLAYNP